MRPLTQNELFAPLLDTHCSLYGGDFDEAALSRDISYQVLLARTLYYANSANTSFTSVRS